MKQPCNLSFYEREHITKSVGRVEDWQISKKEPYMWLIVHRYTRKTGEILASRNYKTTQEGR